MLGATKSLGRLGIPLLRIRSRIVAHNVAAFSSYFPRWKASPEQPIARTACAPTVTHPQAVPRALLFFGGRVARTQPKAVRVSPKEPQP